MSRTERCSGTFPAAVRKAQKMIPNRNPTPDQVEDRVEVLSRELKAEFDELRAKEAVLDVTLASSDLFSDRWWLNLSRLNIIRRDIVAAATLFKNNPLGPTLEAPPHE